jgi:two-component system LytT family response regulator
MNLRSLIVDDEPAARQRLRDLLSRQRGTEVVAEAADVPDALDLVRRDRPDVVFLDIEMPGADGFRLIEQLALEERPAVVFVTAHEQHALKAFDVDAVDYLLKPFGADRLEAALGRVRESVAARRSVAARLGGTENEAVQPSSSRLPIRQNGRISFLDVSDIDWIDAAHNQVRIHAHGRAHLQRDAIGAIEQRLESRRFVRIHRSTIVNIERVQELLVNAAGQYLLVLKNGQRLSVSRSYRDRLREALRLGESREAAVRTS